MSVDEAVERLARAIRAAIAELERGEWPDDSPEARLLGNLRDTLDEWEASTE